MDSLFGSREEDRRRYQPLAERMRPASLDEIAGQEQAVGPGTFLRSMIEKDSIPSLLLFGPPGCGKTTIATVIAHVTKSIFVTLNATESGTKEIRKAAEDARRNLYYYGKRTLFFIDEIHRFNKGQQDIFLPYVENGTFVLIGATTENPYFEVNPPLLSRLRLIRLMPLKEVSLLKILRRALTDNERGLGHFHYQAEDSVLTYIAACSGGDSRISLNILEQAASLLPEGGMLTKEEVRQTAGDPVLRYDKQRDFHYDITSAFIKSMRGSDPDGALHYLARMIEGGEPPSFIARRIMICAAEDVGLADPQALSVAVAAAQAAEMIGFPEGRIPLAEAVLYICLADKSNSSIRGIDAAQKEVRSRADWSIPDTLRDAHYQGASRMGIGIGYRYPHDYGGWVPQQYLPDELKDRIYYRPGAGEKGKGLLRQWMERRSPRQKGDREIDE